MNWIFMICDISGVDVPMLFDSCAKLLVFFWCRYDPYVIIMQKVDVILNNIVIISYFQKCNNSLLLFYTLRSSVWISSNL